MALITIEHGDLDHIRNLVVALPHKSIYANSLGNTVVVFESASAVVAANDPDEAIDIALNEWPVGNVFAQALFKVLVDATSYEIHVYDDYSGEEIAARL